MSVKNHLKQSIYSVLTHNRDGSFETQASRKHILYQMAGELTAGKYKLHHIQGLKQKHVQYLNSVWQSQGLSTATIKNRNAHLRWLCQKINKPQVVSSNHKLGIKKRTYASNAINKAIAIETIDLAKITSPYVRVQIHLQRYLGLRREESIKIKPHLADCGTHLTLQASWCKGGRARQVPIDTPEARYWLNEAKKLAKETNNALIPDNKSYIQHRRLYDKQVNRAGIRHPHGLRHAYAQAFYERLTGFKCPKQGGPTHKKLTMEQKQIYREARSLITSHLGHCRLQIVKNYLGK
jgi:site-specific recombinase XerC